MQMNLLAEWWMGSPLLGDLLRIFHSLRLEGCGILRQHPKGKRSNSVNPRLNARPARDCTAMLQELTCRVH